MQLKNFYIMHVLCKWRSILILQSSSFFQSIKAAESKPSGIHWALFHSTDASFEKWKNKFSFEVKSNQQPSKSHIRYAVRQKRADSKKALKNLLFNAGGSTSGIESSIGVQHVYLNSSFGLLKTTICSSTVCMKPLSKIVVDYEDQLNMKSRIKPARQAKRAYHKKMKRKHRRESSSDDFDENSERSYQTRYDKRYFEWTFRPWEMGFDWKETSSWGKSTSQEQYTKSNAESEYECFTIGTCSDRRTLGLPTTGPLKIEDVKIAFRQSALQWHPDKHQGSSQFSQTAAEERFKNCAKAYKSLCNAFSAT